MPVVLKMKEQYFKGAPKTTAGDQSGLAREEIKLKSIAAVSPRNSYSIIICFHGIAKIEVLLDKG
jgi:hypothetical protein